MDNTVPATSAGLGAGAPSAAIITLPAENSELGALWRRYDALPIRLGRTREGRELSLDRYQRAGEFMGLLTSGTADQSSYLFYSAGIVAQLAMSSHLLDVGFPDMWCAKYIGLHVDRSLAYANATAFGYEDTATERLMEVLSPYWKWNSLSRAQGIQPGDGGFAAEEVREIIAALVGHVAEVTGHGRPAHRVARS
ncbi:hypothetical protein [Novosphingobium album (ex Liu et al. 2023)]|uniref:HEPN domain-containing protein n=1 Tax=Novosphingobium album (ex Liu et al. 2023) TaxID=3031130 RepID=A0ABT5WR69_9SPHN|nr:hypothetical protein [Novosphingobium album (ex Liu et al. 2023)]MDE8652550.1 hypothetical protein [Novosphingobium album (ex Liu et al. 2023)]